MFAGSLCAGQPPQGTAAAPLAVVMISSTPSLVSVFRTTLAGFIVVLLGLCFLPGCASTYKLPKMQPVPQDRYPPASRRLGEEGRVLVEFHLDEHRQPITLTISEAEGSARLNVAAMRVIKALQFDPSDRSTSHPKYTYRVTVIFCLQPGNCDQISAYPDTEAVFVKGTKLPVLDLPFS
jgi:TonB family protein